MSILIQIVIAIATGIICHYICKWLDSINRR